MKKQSFKQFLLEGPILAKRSDGIDPLVYGYFGMIGLGDIRLCSSITDLPVDITDEQFEKLLEITFSPQDAKRLTTVQFGHASLYVVHDIYKAIQIMLHDRSYLGSLTWKEFAQRVRDILENPSNRQKDLE